MAKDLNKKEKKIKKEVSKTRKKINPFDVIIVLLLLCLLGTLAYRVYDGVTVKNSKKDSKYVMTFECEGVYSSLVDSRYLLNNTAVYLSDGDLLGYIYTGKNGEAQVSIIERMTEEASETEDLESVDNATEKETDTSYVYEKVKIRGKIRLNSRTVKVNNGGYYSVDDMDFAVGSVFEVHTEMAVFTLKVVSVETLE